MAKRSRDGDDDAISFAVLRLPGRATRTIEMHNGVMHGIDETRSRSGVLMVRRTWVNGKLEGEITTWFGGKLASRAQMANGVRHGTYEAWNASGVRTLAEDWVAGRPVPNSRRRWTGDGELMGRRHAAPMEDS